MRLWTALVSPRLKAGLCEHGNESPGSIKGHKVLDQLSNYWFFKIDSAVLSYFLERVLVVSIISAVAVELVLSAFQPLDPPTLPHSTHHNLPYTLRLS
jgi:hypothetical protein